MDPITLAAIIGGGAAVAGAGTSAISAGKMNKRAVKYAKEENELNRQFQSQQAQLSRQWTEDFYNQYSSPGAMVKQYQAAGLNPALMYGSGQTVGSTPSSASPSGGSSISPDLVNPMQSFEQLGSIGSQLAGMFKLKADIDNVKADTEYKREQTEAMKIQNFYNPYQFEQDLKQGQLNLQNTQYGFKLAEMQLKLGDDELLNNLINRNNTLANTFKTNVEGVKTLLEQGLVIAETNLAKAKAREVNADAFRKEWLSDFIKQNDIDPSLANSMYSLMVQFAGSIDKKVFGSPEQPGAIQKGWDFLNGRNTSFSLDNFLKDKAKQGFQWIKRNYKSVYNNK